MISSEYIKFHIYRYQIVPISQNIQLTALDQEIKNQDELLAKKNQLFAKAILENKVFSFSWGEIIHTIKSENETYFDIRFGVKRTIHRDKPDFTVEDIDSWPNIRVIIDNRPNAQITAIQIKRSAFEHTQTVEKILEDNINRYLTHFQLQAHFYPIVEKFQFWELVSKFKGRIIGADFEMVSPNMSNISKNLDDAFKQFIQDSNSQKTQIDLKSDKDSSLTLNQDDNFLNGIVNYILEGSGNISLKIKHLKKIIHTSECVKEISLAEIEIANQTPSQLAANLKDLLNE